MASAATSNSSHNSQTANRRNNPYTLIKSGLNQDPSLFAASQQQLTMNARAKQHNLQLQHQRQMEQQTTNCSNTQSTHMSDTHVQNNHHHQHQQHNAYFLKQNLQNSGEFTQQKSNLIYRNNETWHLSGRSGYDGEVKFNLNNLVWAKLYNFPWWPCKIVSDSNNEFSKVIDNTLTYHIQFFGPLVERAWVSYINIFRYKGIESFKIYAQDQVDRALSKSAKEKLAERFQLKVALNRRDQWEQAIEQADLYLLRNLDSNHENMVYVSKQHEKSRSANLANSVARLNQINEEKIHGRLTSGGANYNCSQSIKRKRELQISRKNLQDEFVSGHLAENGVKLNDSKFKKTKKTQKLSGHDIKTEDFNHQQYHSIESIRNEKNTRFNDSYNSTSHPMHIQSSQHSDNQLQNIYNKTTYSKKKLTENNQGTEPLEEHEILQNDSDQSQNSESSDEDNDSLFQPTSIFEYDIEQPVHQTGGVVMSRDNAMAKNFENLNSMHHEMPQAINSIVTEIKNNTKLEKTDYYHDIADQEFNILNSFVTSDSEEDEDKMDKNDTEWSNTSLKTSKRKSSQKSTTKKTSTKFNQKLFVQQPTDSDKKTFENKLSHQATSSPLKKKRGRKPKFTLESVTYASAEDRAVGQQQTVAISGQQTAWNNSLEQDSTSKVFQKICGNSVSISSNNSSRRTSDTSNLSATSDDEVFNETEKNKQNLVLMEDSSVLNQPDAVQNCKKPLKIKTKSVKKAVQPKKRNSKASGNSELTTLEQINQIADLDYNQFVDENITVAGGLTQSQTEETGGLHLPAAAEQCPATANTSTAETYLIDRYKYAVRHIRQGLSVEEACNKYRISKGALLKCLSGGTAPRGKKTRLTESEENEIVEWLINNKDLKYNEAIHLVFEQVEKIFELAQRPNPFNNGKPSMDWWYDFLSRHPQIMASKPDWLMRGKVNDQYIKDVQSGQLKCTKFRRALLSAIQYIRSLNDAQTMATSNTYRSPGQINTVNKSITSGQAFKVAPGLSNRIEKNDSTLSKVSAVRQTKQSQKSTYCKNSLLKRKGQPAENSKQSDSAEVQLSEEIEGVEEEVPSPTSLDTRIFNSENNTTSNTCPTSQDFSFVNQKATLPESCRPIKNEKSIQDSLEYLYEQNNNFINEISNINQLMDAKNSGNGVVNSQSNDQENSSVKESKFYDENAGKQVIDNNFDSFLDQALNNSSHQNNFDDLIDSKIVDTSALSLGVGSSNLSTSPSTSSNFNGNGSTCSSIISDFVNGNDSNYITQSFNTTNLTSDESYFQSNLNQTNYFDQNSLYKSPNQACNNMTKKNDNQQSNQLNSTFYLNNMTENSLLLNTQCGFNNYTQSQPFNTKLDFTQKNHLLVQDDDDENEDDIELVNSILSNNNEENLDDGDSGMINNSIDPSGFLP